MTASPTAGDGSARREHILTELGSAGFLAVTDLARELGVSDMTVRRDLRKLAAAGQVKMVHGGASLPHGTLQTPGFIGRAGANAAAKARIAQAALGLVAEGDTVAIDAGTTGYALATAWPRGHSGAVVTHSVPVIQLALSRPDCRLVGLGGDLYRPSQAFVGPMTVDAARNLRLRTFFLGASAVDGRGAYVDTDVERPTKHALMDIADDVVLLADRAKFSTSAPVLLCGLDRIGAVVTDAAPSRSLRERLDEAGVRLVTCDGEQ